MRLLQPCSAGQIAWAIFFGEKPLEFHMEAIYYHIFIANFKRGKIFVQTQYLYFVGYQPQFDLGVVGGNCLQRIYQPNLSWALKNGRPFWSVHAEHT